MTLADRVRQAVMQHDGDRQAMYVAGRDVLLQHPDDPGRDEALRSFALMLGLFTADEADTWTHGYDPPDKEP